MIKLNLNEYTNTWKRGGPWLTLPVTDPKTLANGADWITHTPWGGDFGSAKFLDVPPLSISHAMLKITMTNIGTPTAPKWVSGLLAGADGTGAHNGSAVQYGYFEARLQMPTGPGVWPAFWLVSNRVNPKTDPDPYVEVDVVEYYGVNQATGQYSATVHRWKTGETHAPYIHEVTGLDLSAAFHRYGVRIAPDLMTFYFDRQPVWEIPTPVEHNLPVYPILNLAAGAGWPIDQMISPSVMQIDYVEVWS